jgi:hypothetical protein
MTPSRWSSAIAILRRRICREEEARLLLREPEGGGTEPSLRSRWLPFTANDCARPGSLSDGGADPSDGLRVERTDDLCVESDDDGS